MGGPRRLGSWPAGRGGLMRRRQSQWLRTCGGSPEPSVSTPLRCPLSQYPGSAPAAPMCIVSSCVTVSAHSCVTLSAHSCVTVSAQLAAMYTHMTGLTVGSGHEVPAVHFVGGAEWRWMIPIAKPNSPRNRFQYKNIPNTEELGSEGNF